MIVTLEIEAFTLGALQTNCYLLSNTANQQAVIIDPADDGDFLNDELLRRGLTLEKIVLTHGHFDHCLGLLSLKSAWGAPVLMHFADQFLLEGAAASAKHWLGVASDPVPPADVDLASLKEINIFDHKFEVIPTPGHTPGSVCLLSRSDKILFSGDTIFAGGSVGRTDFAYSNRQKMSASLMKLKSLQQAGHYGQVYPGHGESFFS
jgi:hydroxyacylglutathione hydrolase